MEVRELAVPDMAAASARALAALKLVRLFSRCPNGSAGIAVLFSAFAEASRDFPADAVRLGEPFCDFLPPEPADVGRASVMASTRGSLHRELGEILPIRHHSTNNFPKQCAPMLNFWIPNYTIGYTITQRTLQTLSKP